MQYEYEALCVSIVSLIFAFIGGCFALLQWRKSLVYKRTEIVQALIVSTRENKNVSAIMDIIDWNEDFHYDGRFVVNKNTNRTMLKDLSGDDLFKIVDHTLSIFSYICYLKSVGTIKGTDMRFFEYEIHRIIDNCHIRNYLYSLYHWSDSLGVNMSFSYLVDYCLKKKYLDKSFKVYSESHPYCKCFLCIKPSYQSSLFFSLRRDKFFFRKRS